jgi:hypothetical protein
MKKIILALIIALSFSIAVSAQTSIDVDGRKDNTGYLILWTVNTDLDRYYVILYLVRPNGPKDTRKPELLTWRTTSQGQFYLPVGTTKYDFYFDIRNSAGEIVYTQDVKNSEIKKVDNIWEY